MEDNFSRYQFEDVDDGDISPSPSDDDDSEELPQVSEYASQPLYSGAAVTIGQTVRLIRRHAVRAILNQRRLGLLLDLMSKLLPAGNCCPSTLFKFEQAENLISPLVPIALNHCCGSCGNELHSGRCVNEDRDEGRRGIRQWSSYGYGFSDPGSQFCCLLQGPILSIY